MSLSSHESGKQFFCKTLWHNLLLRVKHNGLTSCPSRSRVWPSTPGRSPSQARRFDARSIAGFWGPWNEKIMIYLLTKRHYLVIIYSITQIPLIANRTVVFHLVSLPYNHYWKATVDCQKRIGFYAVTLLSFCAFLIASTYFF